MVAQQLWRVLGAIVPLLGQAPSRQFLGLPPTARARLLAALFLVAIGGVAFVTLTWLALRVGRRNLRRWEHQSPSRWSNAQLDDWAKKPLAPKPPARLDADDD